MSGTLTKRELARRIWREWRQLIVFIVLMFAFRSAVADWNVVPSGSMQPSILIGDRIWVNKLAYDVKIPWTDINLNRHAEPQRGDIIVFTSPLDGERLVKRILGLPGDRVGLVANRLQLGTGVASYTPITPDAYTTAEVGVSLWLEEIDGATHPVKWHSSPRNPGASFAPTTVPEDHYLVLGDNRDNSADSRSIGFVPRAAIIGRAGRVLVSLDPENFYLPRARRLLQRLP